MVSHGTTGTGHISTGHTAENPFHLEGRSDDRTVDDQAVDPRVDDSKVYDQAIAEDRSTADEQPTADDQAPSRDEATGVRPVEEQEPVELHPTTTTAGDSPLFSTDDTENFQVEWRALQSEFVDDPREAVQRADELVAQVMQTLSDTFTEHKHALEEQWRQGEQVQTEELRQALKRYRAFFDRLLAV